MRNIYFKVLNQFCIIIKELKHFQHSGVLKYYAQLACIQILEIIGLVQKVKNHLTKITQSNSQFNFVWGCQPGTQKTSPKKGNMWLSTILKMKSYLFLTKLSIWQERFTRILLSTLYHCGHLNLINFHRYLLNGFIEE